MRLKGQKVLFLIDDHFEDLELFYPLLRLQEEGATCHLVAKETERTYAGKNGLTAQVDYHYSDITLSDYDALFIPGGWAPDRLRRDERVLEIVRYMDDKKQPIANICHAGSVLISAGIIAGKKVTSSRGIKDDLVNAGAEWVDEAVVCSENLISSRGPKDLPIFAKTFADVLAQLRT